MFYNARWYDPYLNHMTQPDSIVPPGVQGLDRYAYVNNSPLNYVDPSGHICVESDGDSDVGMAGNCHGGSNPKYKPGLQGSPSGWADSADDSDEENESISAQSQGICSSDHPSVICRDPNSIGEGTAWSEPAYPTRVPPSSWEPATAELTVHPLWSGILLLSDMLGYYHYSDLPFKASSQFVFGGADYKIIEMSPGLRMRTPTSIMVGNNTNSDFMISSMYTDYHEILPANNVINRHEGVVFRIAPDVYLPGGTVYINLSSRDLKVKITIDLYSGN